MVVEDIQKQIKAEKSYDSLEKIKDLNRNLFEIAAALSNLDPKTLKTDYYSLKSEYYKKFDELSDADKFKILDRLTLGYGKYALHAYKMQKDFSFQTGSLRRSFRSPNDLENTIVGRVLFVQELARIFKYKNPLSWYAKYTNYMYFINESALGKLLAAAIDLNDDEGKEIFKILKAILNDELEDAKFGRYIVYTFLFLKNPEGWELLNKLLIIAQLQEGLRQSIVESMDEGHLEAFTTILKTIIDNKLYRFSSVVRAVDVWFSFDVKADKQKLLEKILNDFYLLLTSEAVREAYLTSKNNQEVYLALYAYGFIDSNVAVEKVVKFTKSEDPEKRYLAAKFLGEIRNKASYLILETLLKDDDIKVVAKVLYGMRTTVWGRHVFSEVFEDLIERFPKKKTVVEGYVWKWEKIEIDVQQVFSYLIRRLDESEVPKLLKYIDVLDSNNRSNLLRHLKSNKDVPHIRKLLVQMIGDKSSSVRYSALDAIKDDKFTKEEMLYINSLLYRKDKSLRKSVFELILKQPDSVVLESISYLLNQENKIEQTSGLDLADALLRTERSKKEVQKLLSTNQITETLSDRVENIKTIDLSKLSLDDCLGLIDIKNLSKGIPPQQVYRDSFFQGKNFKFTTDGANYLIKNLSDYIDINKDMLVKFVTYNKEEEMPLGNVPGWHITAPKQGDTFDNLKLKDVWKGWYESLDKSKLDVDGLDFLRAKSMMFVHDLYPYQYIDYPWIKKTFSILHSNINKEILPYFNIIFPVINWYVFLDEHIQNSVQFIIDAAEYNVSLVPKSDWQDIRKLNSNVVVSWRDYSHLIPWYQFLEWHFSLNPEKYTDAQVKKVWGLLKWFDEPINGGFRRRTIEKILLIFYSRGCATVEDVYDFYIGPRNPRSSSWFHLRNVTRKVETTIMKEFPVIKELINNIRERIIEVELSRGELNTPVSEASMNIMYVEGVDYAAKFLNYLSNDKISRKGSWWQATKFTTISHLIQVTYPSPADTYEDFKNVFDKYKFKKNLIIDFAFYSPHWASFIEKYLEIPGLEQAVWWVRAHTKDRSWSIDKDLKERWDIEIKLRTSLSIDELVDGAVDIEWFKQILNILGESQWLELLKSAKYATSGTGHTRAVLFAETICGIVTKQQLLEKINSTRNQDYLRAYGLVKLEGSEDLIERFNRIQLFKKESKQFGSQRQASEKLAIEIALTNLANLSGYTNALRLSWAMEAKLLDDIRDGFIESYIADTTIRLELISFSEVNLKAIKGSSLLKTIPSEIKKDSKYVELNERKKQITSQLKRTKQTLEDLMINREVFSGRELLDLINHPLLSFFLKKLVFVSDKEIGFPNDSGVLECPNGNKFKINPENQYRIAHVYDIYLSDTLSVFQRFCFDKEVTQPFKQIFRELYLLTEDEKINVNSTLRYAGHQVQPNQSKALFRTRGWIAEYEEGIKKVFHKDKIYAEIYFTGDLFTPLDVEGLTFEQVVFFKKSDNEIVNLTDINPIIFSETMRDLDLVVSVANMGGIDLEASQSTMEMRKVLVTETARLMNLTNVRVDGNFVFIDGSIGNYTVHLGSSVIHKRPGGSISVAAIQSQHRGRLFLPFIDSDPRSAEVVSKVIMLAEDGKIKDPGILNQILISVQ